MTTTPLIPSELVIQFDTLKFDIENLIKSRVFSDDAEQQLKESLSLFYELFHHNKFDGNSLQNLMTTETSGLISRLTQPNFANLLKPLRTIFNAKIDQLISLYYGEFNVSERETIVSFSFSLKTACDYYASDGPKTNWQVSSDLDYSAKYLAQILQKKTDEHNDTEFIGFLNVFIGHLQKLQNCLHNISRLQSDIFKVRFLQTSLIRLLPGFFKQYFAQFKIEYNELSK